MSKKVVVAALVAVLALLGLPGVVLLAGAGAVVTVLAGDSEAEGLAGRAWDSGSYSTGDIVFNVSDSTFVDTGSYAWGGFSNGQVPAGELCAIAHDPSERARCDAAEAMDALNAAFRAAFGHDLAITDSYRSYAEQVAIKAEKGDLAATPGYSNHGWGLAFDLGSGCNDYASGCYAWMKANGAGFGFFHPTWAEPGHPDYAKAEPWHWQFVPGSVGGSGVSDGTPAGNRALGESMAAARGWAGEQFVCLDKLWTRESGWRVNADNPTSSAYGIPQMLTGVHDLPGDYMTNPATQIDVGLDYIAGRYASPCGAWAHSQQTGWY